MGGVSQKSKICIEVDCPVVLAGEELKGNVHLFIASIADNLVLTLELFGGEKVTYLMGGEADWYNNRVDYPQSGGVLCRKKSLSCGFYSFPFAFRTSKKLPGSMKTYDSYHKASISYILSAEASANSLKTLTTTTPVVIRQYIKHKQILETSPKLDQLKHFNFVSNKKTSFKVDVSKKSFRPNENVYMQVTFDNCDCEVNLKAIEVGLHRNIHFEFCSGRKSDRDQVVMSYIHTIRVPNDSPLLMNCKSVGFSFLLDFKDKHIEGCGTSFGKIIESKYFFEVTAKFGNYAAPVRIFVPVIIEPEEVIPKVCEMFDGQIEMPVSTIEMD
ncbi:hypothetical protein SteCoe_8476 [Stentor coeruleus]|uniref:Arrestin C-terminal-like domain-containing protein n=1 Tax=Stentor coeruleus TaxID=5963 RepID=A0A1R2CK97_9CILI|nr:hypothetical protein SteCoe_8476 [Stentor coeruleus]